MQGQDGMNLESVLKAHLMDLQLHRVLIVIREAKTLNESHCFVVFFIVTNAMEILPVVLSL